MASLTIHCPECGATLNSTEALQPGKLVDCPRCRLLFAPTPDDLRPAQSQTPSALPRPSPWRAPRRRRPNSVNEMLVILIAGGVMLVLAGVVIGTYVLLLQRPAAPTSPMPSAPTAPAPPTVVPAVEVEDPNRTPLRPVPRLDDPPDRGGPPKGR
jgi:DNA-directed RNA polymerase subunit RPC12/RpoP